MDDSARSNGRGGRFRRKRGSRAPLTLKINALLDALLWLNLQLTERNAADFTPTELARLFGLHGENFATLACMLGQTGLLAPKTVQQICIAYDQGLSELLHHHEESL
ncbi:MAG: hypothetical protein ACUVSF_13595 [Anaerolineae bacterium]